MVSRVVLPTPRWPKTPTRCGRHKRSANSAAAARRMETILGAKLEAGRAGGDSRASLSSIVIRLLGIHIGTGPQVRHSCLTDAAVRQECLTLQEVSPMKRVLICGVCWLALATPIVLAQDAKPEVRIEKDVVYGKGG